MRVAVVIPALNESATVAEVVRGAAPHGTTIVVDDGSADGTAEAAAAAGAEVVRHSSSRGYDGALASGFARAESAGFDVLVSLDADGQHDPGLLREVVAPIVRGEADVVLGVRPAAARPSERVFAVYTRLRFGVPDILCGVKAYSLAVYRAHRGAAASRTIGTGLALAALRDGARFRLVAVPIGPRPGGGSRFGRALALRPNARILWALVLALAADVRHRLAAAPARG